MAGGFTLMKKILCSNQGQIVLMIVLVTVVGLTIGLSLISRTITDIRISSQIEQSGRAFSAAEAGVENVLKSNIQPGPTGNLTLEGATVNYSVKNLGGSADAITFQLTESGDDRNLWLVGHNEDGSLNEAVTYSPASNLEICWGTKKDSYPAIIVSLMYKHQNTYKIAKKAFDSQSRGNNFIVVDDNSGGYCNGEYNFRIILNPSSDPQDPNPSISKGGLGVFADSILYLLRIQPLYESTGLKVVPQDPLPVQGKIITSIGQTDTGVVRKIQAYQSFPVLPSIFDYTLFSEN
jgi:Tfp pilus assembly protein PilX